MPAGDVLREISGSVTLGHWPLHFPLFSHVDWRFQMTSRKGMTLIELITTIAIVGIVMGLLLPAIVVIREHARAVACKSRLKDIGLAIQQFEASTSRLPGRHELPWSVEVMPSLSEPQFHSAFQVNIDPTDSPNRELGRSVLMSLVCPSAEMHTIGPNKWSPSFYALSSQVAGASIARIKDGTSHTVGTFEYAMALEPWIQPPLFEIGTEDVGNRRHIGLHVGMMDGSVRSISKSVSSETLTAISTASGGEVVTDY